MSKSIFDGTLTATPNNKGDIRLGAIVGWGNEPCILRIESCFENGKYNGITDNAQTAFCRKYDSTTTPNSLTFPGSPSTVAASKPSPRSLASTSKEAAKL